MYRWRSRRCPKSSKRYRRGIFLIRLSGTSDRRNRRGAAIAGVFLVWNGRHRNGRGGLFLLTTAMLYNGGRGRGERRYCGNWWLRSRISPSTSSTVRTVSPVILQYELLLYCPGQSCHFLSRGLTFVTIYKDLRLMMLLIWHWFAAMRRCFTNFVYGNGGWSCNGRYFVGLFLQIVVAVVCIQLM